MTSCFDLLFLFVKNSFPTFSALSCRRIVSFPSWSDDRQHQPVQYAGWSPTGHALSFVFENNLYYQQSPDTTPYQVGGSVYWRSKSLAEPPSQGESFAIKRQSVHHFWVKSFRFSASVELCLIVSFNFEDFHYRWQATECHVWYSMEFLTGFTKVSRQQGRVVQEAKMQEIAAFSNNQGFHFHCVLHFWVSKAK